MKDILKIIIPFALLIILGIWGTFQFVEPPPPKSIVIATGEKTGAYYQNAKKYLSILKKDGIELNIIETKGSINNIELLKNSNNNNNRIDLAFIQSGTFPKELHENYYSLGSLYYEPLWIFYQNDLNIQKLKDLKGKKIILGPQKSGTSSIARQLLKLNGVTNDNSQLLEVDNDESLKLMKLNQVSAMFIVGDINHPSIKFMLNNEDYKLFDCKRVKAYKKNLKYLSDFVLYEGSIDIEKNIPENDVNLLSPLATIVVRKDIHPALVVPILKSLFKVHDQETFFNQKGEFPSVNYTQVEVHPHAKDFIENGPGFFEKVLPFWLASIINRLKIMLLPLLTIILPLIKIFPAVYKWQIRNKIIKWYKDLSKIDQNWKQLNKKISLEQLKTIEDKVRRINVPNSYAEELFNLKLHIQKLKDNILS